MFFRSLAEILARRGKEEKHVQQLWDSGVSPWDRDAARTERPCPKGHQLWHTRMDAHPQRGARLGTKGRTEERFPPL